HCKKCFIEQLIDFDDAMMKCVEDVAAVRASSDCRHEPANTAVSAHRRLADVRLSAGLRRRPLRAARSVPAQPVPSGQRMRGELHQLGLPVPLSVWFFVGDTCSIDVNECLSAPCANGGSCVNTEGGYSCQCPAGFEAIDCRLNARRGGCYNGGVCSGDFDGKCRCVDGFSGTRCEVPPQSESVSDPCASNQPCLHGGLCRSFAATGTFVCDCASGWLGLRCEQLLNPCTESSCLGRGRCLPTAAGGFNCRCHAGFRGRYCEHLSQPTGLPTVQPEPCNSSRWQSWCLNGGRCFQLVGVELPVCQCRRGFTGSRCQIDVNECEQFGGACLNGGECVDEPGGFRCTCKPGFQ
uniref:Delta-like protein n=1 Tax=Macrostomum lignano TaxID=282301 RepID=A0A1I8JNS9_9PLAT